MRPELERVLRTCLADARAEREAREALRIALDSGEPEALSLLAAQDRSGREISVDAEAVEAVAHSFARWGDRPRLSRRALLRDLGITVRVVRPRPREIAVESVEIRALTSSRDGVRLYN